MAIKNLAHSLKRGAFCRQRKILQAQQGFTLLVAIIFMSVMLAFGLAVSALAYKQQVLASTAIQSQYAFYAADAGLECALYADQQQGLFTYAEHSAGNPPNSITCDGVSAAERLSYSYDATRMVIKERFRLDSDTRCADVTVYKSPGAVASYIFSQGYDVPCSVVGSPSGQRFNSRGIYVRY